jgi:hypothetical protein
MNFGEPNRQERLHNVAEHLHLVFSEDPLTRSDAFASLLRRLYHLEDELALLPSVEQMCAGIKPDHGVEFIVVCPGCGQMFDCRDSGQLTHHSGDTHKPKLD